MNSWRSWIYGGAKSDGRFSDTSFVYVLRAPFNLCKIGHTHNPVWRVRIHRKNCRSPLELICLVRIVDTGATPRAADLAKRLHNYFRAQGRKKAEMPELQQLGWHQWHDDREQSEQQYEWYWLTDEDVTWLRGKTTEEVDNVVAQG